MPSVRVAIADDSSAYRKALSEFLERLPSVSVVAVAEDGVEALEWIAQTAPDVLLLDMRMPRMDGLEVLRYLQSIHSPVRVLAISAHSDEFYRRKALELGALAYVEKGNVQHLIDTLHQLVDAHGC